MRRISRGRSGEGRRTSGFSLIELMTAIAVLAVLMAIAVPSFTSLINSNRLATQANEITASLQYARSEAIRGNRTVTLCPSGNGTSCSDAGGWSRLITLAGETVLRDTALSGKTTISADVDEVNFSSDGLARGDDGLLATATITVCMDTTRPAENQRVITLTGGSRTSVQHQTGTCP